LLFNSPSFVSNSVSFLQFFKIDLVFFKNLKRQKVIFLKALYTMLLVGTLHYKYRGHCLNFGPHLFVLKKVNF